MAGTDKLYRGERLLNGTVRVMVMHPVDHDRTFYDLHHVELHSQDFEWGYGGSGPADLALSILADYFGEKPGRDEIGWKDFQCTRYHQDFKWQFIATLPQSGTWFILGKTIEEWLKLQIAKEVLA